MYPNNVSLDLQEAIFTRKILLKTLGKIENRIPVEFGLNRELNLSTSPLITSQYTWEFSFLVTANEIELSVTGHMRVQWNFRGVKLINGCTRAHWKNQLIGAGHLATSKHQVCCL